MLLASKPVIKSGSSLYVFLALTLNIKTRLRRNTANMMPGKSGRANLEEEKTFQAKYLGCTNNNEPGVNGIDKAVKRIYDAVKNEEKTCPKVSLEVKKDEMTITQGQKKTSFAIKDISYCSLNRLDSNIFAFNHHVSKSPFKVECHAVMCTSEEKAKAIGQALYCAYREGHFEELRKKRKKKVNEQFKDSNISSAPSEKPEDSRNSDSDSQMTSNCGSTAEVVDNELDCIVQDMLNTVEREKESLEDQTEELH